MRLSEVWRNDWTSGWTSLVPLHVGNNTYLLSYKAGDGKAALDRVNDNGTLDEVWRDNWTPGWTSFVPITMTGRRFLLSYKVGSGVAASDRFSNLPVGGLILRLAEDWRTTWTPGWTSFVPLLVNRRNGKQHLLSYKSGAGTAALDRVDPFSFETPDTKF